MTLDLFGPEPEPRRICHVYAFRSGAVLCFDQYNRVIPEYRGEWDRLEPRIRAASDPDTKFHVPYDSEGLRQHERYRR